MMMHIERRFAASLFAAGVRQKHTNPLGPSRGKTPPPWVIERLMNEGYNKEDIKSNWEALIDKKPSAWLTDVTNKLHRNYDLSPRGIKDMLKKAEYEKFKASQTVDLKSQSVVGPDLSAAYFVLQKGGAVRFKNHQGWLEGIDADIRLPRTWNKSFLLEAIDLRNFQILHRGFKNFARCKHLVSLKLINQKFVDDWCLDSISGMFGLTIEYLDVSGCERVTERGLSCLHRCKNLKLLNVYNMPSVKNPQLLGVLLEEVLPMLEIRGINYSNKQ